MRRSLCALLVALLAVQPPAAAAPAPSASSSPSCTASASSSSSASASASSSPSPTSSESGTPTTSASRSPARTLTRTRSPTRSASASTTVSETPSPSSSASQTRTASMTGSVTPSVTGTSSVTPSKSSSPTKSRSASASSTPTSSPSSSMTRYPTLTPSSSPVPIDPSTLTFGLDIGGLTVADALEGGNTGVQFLSLLRQGIACGVGADAASVTVVEVGAVDPASGSVSRWTTVGDAHPGNAPGALPRSPFLPGTYGASPDACAAPLLAPWLGVGTDAATLLGGGSNGGSRLRGLQSLSTSRVIAKLALKVSVPSAAVAAYYSALASGTQGYVAAAALASAASNAVATTRSKLLDNLAVFSFAQKLKAAVAAGGASSPAAVALNATVQALSSTPEVAAMLRMLGAAGVRAQVRSLLSGRASIDAAAFATAAAVALPGAGFALSAWTPPGSSGAAAPLAAVAFNAALLAASLSEGVVANVPSSTTPTTSDLLVAVSGPSPRPTLSPTRTPSSTPSWDPTLAAMQAAADAGSVVTLSDGAIAGIAVGAFAGALLVVAAAASCARRQNAALALAAAARSGGGGDGAWYGKGGDGGGAAANGLAMRVPPPTALAGHPSSVTAAGLAGGPYRAISKRPSAREAAASYGQQYHEDEDTDTVSEGGFDDVEPSPGASSVHAPVAGPYYPPTSPALPLPDPSSLLPSEADIAAAAAAAGIDVDTAAALLLTDAQHRLEAAAAEAAALEAEAAAAAAALAAQAPSPVAAPVALPVPPSPEVLGMPSLARLPASAGGAVLGAGGLVMRGRGFQAAAAAVLATMPPARGRGLAPAPLAATSPVQTAGAHLYAVDPLSARRVSVGGGGDAPASGRAAAPHRRGSSAGPSSRRSSTVSLQGGQGAPAAAPHLLVASQTLQPGAVPVSVGAEQEVGAVFSPVAPMRPLDATSPPPAPPAFQSNILDAVSGLNAEFLTSIHSMSPRYKQASPRSVTAAAVANAVAAPAGNDAAVAADGADGGAATGSAQVPHRRVGRGAGLRLPDPEPAPAPAPAAPSSSLPSPLKLFGPLPNTAKKADEA